MKLLRYAAAFLVALTVHCHGALAGQASTDSSALEQRIQRIQSHILGPVVDEAELAGPTLLGSDELSADGFEQASP